MVGLIKDVVIPKINIFEHILRNTIQKDINSQIYQPIWIKLGPTGRTIPALNPRWTRPIIIMGLVRDFCRV